MHRPLLVLAATLAASLPLAAQRGPALLTPGARVRVSAPEVGVRRMTTALLDVRGDTLVLRTGRPDTPLHLLASDIRRMEVSRGRASPVRNGLRGMGWGATAGAATGVVIGAADDGDDHYQSRTEVALFTGLAMGMLGGAVGTVAGVASAGEDWETVAPPYRFASPAEAAAAAPAAPPAPRGPEAGSCVRLSAPGSRLRNVVATVRGVEADSLVLDDPHGGPALRVALADVRRAYLWGGAYTPGQAAGRNAWRGFAGGALIGGVLGVLGHDDSDASGFLSVTPGEAGVLTGAALGVTSAAVGGAVGAIAPGNRWTRIDRAHLAALPAPDAHAAPAAGCPVRR
jgi:hypothetical protein